MTPRLVLTFLEDRRTPSTVALDTKFGASGRYLLSDSFNVTGAALKQVLETLPDGRVIVGTTATSASGNADFAVFRLTAEGTLDTTFGTNGLVTIPFDLGGANTDVLTSMVVLLMAGSPSAAMPNSQEATPTSPWHA